MSLHGFSFVTPFLFSQVEKGVGKNPVSPHGFPSVTQFLLYRKVSGCETVSESGEIVSES